MDSHERLILKRYGGVGQAVGRQARVVGSLET